jgi:hypothetical protein
MTSDAPCSKDGFSLFREASLPFSNAILIVVGVLIALLGFLLFPVSLGILPFSRDGQLGLLLVITSIQMMALGQTAIGQYTRSWSLIVIGIVFAGMGSISCIVPGILTDVIRMLLGLQNTFAGAIFLITQRLLPMLHNIRNPPAEPVTVPPIFRRLSIILTVSNIVTIAFGISALAPGLIPLLILPAILIVNGLLILVAAYILQKLQ